jgi:hypothetical protein
MVKDDVVKARQIDIDTIGGHVTLTGVVGTRIIFRLVKGPMAISGMTI